MITKQYRRGGRWVQNWIGRGMFSIGKTNPESMIIGIMTKKIAVIMACCWFREVSRPPRRPPGQSKQDRRRRASPSWGLTPAREDRRPLLGAVLPE